MCNACNRSNTNCLSQNSYGLVHSNSNWISLDWKYLSLVPLVTQRTLSLVPIVSDRSQSSVPFIGLNRPSPGLVGSRRSLTSAAAPAAISPNCRSQSSAVSVPAVTSLGFLVSWCLGFLVSCFRSSKVPKFHCFTDSRISSNDFRKYLSLITKIPFHVLSTGRRFFSE